MKDPYDYVEWNPERGHSMSFVLDHREEKRRGRKHADKMGEQWMEHIYDLIALCTLVAVVASLFKLLLN